MKPRPSDEYEIRTPEKNLLVCTIVSTADGSKEIVSRHGKREDRMKIDDFFAQVYSKKKTG